jgi:hypothetical protein
MHDASYEVMKQDDGLVNNLMVENLESGLNPASL